MIPKESNMNTRQLDSKNQKAYLWSSSLVDIRKLERNYFLPLQTFKAKEILSVESITKSEIKKLKVRSRGGSI